MDRLRELIREKIKSFEEMSNGLLPGTHRKSFVNGIRAGLLVADQIVVKEIERMETEELNERRSVSN